MPITSEGLIKLQIIIIQTTLTLNPNPKNNSLFVLIITLYKNKDRSQQITWPSEEITLIPSVDIKIATPTLFGAYWKRKIIF